MLKSPFLLCLGFLTLACSPKSDVKLGEIQIITNAKVDSIRVLEHVRYLSSDELEGRNVESIGSQKARNYILSQLQSFGLKTDTVSFVFGKTNKTGKNIITEIKGSVHPEKYIVLSAHYDHVGVKKDSLATPETDLIFNGADDNASGTGALIEFANYFSKNPSNYSIIFLFADAEEKGLQGARSFAKNDARIKQVILNLNMDMISRSDINTLNVCGLAYTPSLIEVFKSLEKSASIKLTYGHDGKDGLEDWTKSSDHAPFYDLGIPFIYFGVEDHEDYHKVGDEFKKVNYSFYVGASSFILNSIISLDKTIQ